MKKVSLILFVLLVVTLISCKKESNVVVPPEETALEEVVFPSNFDWKTYKQVSISVTGYANSLLEIISDEGVVYQRVFLEKNTPYSGKFSVPSYESTVQLKYMGQLVDVDLGSGSISHQFN
jgi:hypothetical protein